MDMLADDLFAGAGGWDLAAERLGIHARGVENMPQARATRDAAGLETIHDDVWTFKPRYRALTDAEVYAEQRAKGASHRVALLVAGLIASPPCQTFSQAGKGSGRKALDRVLALVPEVGSMTLLELRERGRSLTPPLSNGKPDDRTALVLTPLWFALHHPYRWLAWEQVPTVLPLWEACADVLREVGFRVWTGNVQAEQYGVPQTRKRALLLASTEHDVHEPVPTHSKYHARDWQRMDAGVLPWVSMGQALAEAGFPEWTAEARMVSNYGTGGDPSNRGERLGSQPAPTVTSKVDRNKVYLGTSAHDRAYDKSVPRSTEQPAPTVSFGHAAAQWVWKRPSTTIVGSFKPEVVAAPGYRTTVSRQNAEGSVQVSVAEAGVLQSFPADYPWQGAKGKQYLQAGNAIPPGLALAALEVASGRVRQPVTAEDMRVSA